MTSAGDYAVTFSTGTGGQAPKVRMSYVIVAVNDPNVTAPIDANSVAVTLTPTAGIRVPTTTATTNGSVLLAYAMQDIGGTSLTAPAGLATVGVFDNGGQQVSIGLFSKDRIFSGATPNYSVGTRETANPSIGGSIILRPQ